ncbi:hypothetical protein FACS189473_4410 [Spirochaetia bacterium]|nr:hypothetical protein FACS189473_4410 [Spirochaetia bacterium]
MNIRQAVMPDIPYLYEICLKTGAEGKDAAPQFRDPYLLGQVYAAPYLVYDPSLCFVVDDEARPAGYIVAAADTAAFVRWMETGWLPPLRRRIPDPLPPAQTASGYESRIAALIHRPFTLPSPDPLQNRMRKANSCCSSPFSPW